MVVGDDKRDNNVGVLCISQFLKAECGDMLKERGDAMLGVRVWRPRLHKYLHFSRTNATFLYVCIWPRLCSSFLYLLPVPCVLLCLCFIRYIRRCEWKQCRCNARAEQASKCYQLAAFIEGLVAIVYTLCSTLHVGPQPMVREKRRKV